MDLCLSSLLVPFISLYFSLLWKTSFLQTRQLLDGSSTNSLLSTDSFCWDLVLDRYFDPSSYDFYLYAKREIRFIFHFSLFLSRQIFLSLAPNTFPSLKSLYPLHFRPILSSDYLLCVLKSFIYMHSCILDLGFGVLEIFWSFWDFGEIVGLGVVVLTIYALELHSHCILTMFHEFRCVFDYCWMCAGRFGLGFYP